MSIERKIEMLRAMMDGDNTDDAILEVYLELAGGMILNRMYQFTEQQNETDVPEKYIGIQLKIANYLLNKRGAEGEVQHIENGIHRNYGSSDVPDSMLKDIVPFVAVLR